MKRVLLLMLISLVLLTGCNREKKFDFSKGTIVVGLEAAYAPFNWMETEPTSTNHELDGMNAYVEGYDVQIAKRLAEDLGLKLVIKMIDWKGLIPALNSGMIDMIIAGMSPTQERMNEISFTDKYYESEHVVIVSKNGIYANVSKISDFSNAKIVGQRDTLYDELAGQIAKASNASHQTPLAKIPEIVNALNTGVSDVTVVEKPVAISIVNNNDKLKYIKLTTPFDLDLSDTIVSIGLRKNDLELKVALNASLAKISVATREELMLAASNHAPGEE